LNGGHIFFADWSARPNFLQPKYVVHIWINFNYF